MSEYVASGSVSKVFTSLDIKVKQEVAKSVFSFIFHAEFNLESTLDGYRYILNIGSDKLEILKKAGLSRVHMDSVWNLSKDVIVDYLDNILQKYFTVDFDINFKSSTYEEMTDSDRFLLICDVLKIINKEFIPDLGSVYQC